MNAVVGRNPVQVGGHRSVFFGRLPQLSYGEGQGLLATQVVEAQLANTFDVKHYFLRSIVHMYYLVEYLFAVGLNDEDGIILVTVQVGIAQRPQHKTHLIVAWRKVEDDEPRLVAGYETGSAGTHAEAVGIAIFAHKHLFLLLRTIRAVVPLTAGLQFVDDVGLSLKDGYREEQEKYGPDSSCLLFHHNLRCLLVIVCLQNYKKN